MCSLSGDILIEECGIKMKKMDKCKKCLIEKPVIVLRKTDSYCKPCFLAATVHKFRATLGKYRIIHPNEPALIIYRAGHQSTSLLHFIHTGLNLQQHKKLRLEPVVLYIDDLERVTKEERQNIHRNVAAEILSYNFSGYITSLDKYIEDINSEPYYKEISANFDSDLLEDEESGSNKKCPSRTLHDDSFNICRRQLIFKMAKKLNCRIVFTPEISVDVAVSILGNISLGRGSHIPLDAGICDDRDAEIKILQPLRYFEMKELAFYNIFNGLEPPTYMESYNNVSTPSVNNLITKFVFDLQENYPSTIKTVVRTGDKLTYSKTGRICKLCKAPIEQQEELSSSEAKSFSHWVSTCANDINLNKYTFFSANSETNLCYGCSNLSNILQL